MALVDATLADNVRMVPTETIVRTQSALGLGSLRVAEALQSSYGLVVAERMRVGDLQVANQKGRVTLADALVFRDALRQARDALVADIIWISQSQVASRVVQIVEQLRLSSTLAGGARYRMSLVQGLRLADSLARFFGASVSETLAVTDPAVVKLLAAAGITERVGIGSTIAPVLLLSVVLSDGVAIDDNQLLRMLFKPTIREGIAIEAGYLSPNGSFTTWAMNTRTGAVTEYADYAFNSFARVGQRYLGASEDGLCELLGDDDAGDDIIARVQSGYLQFGGTQLSRLKEAYLAVRNDGAFVLRVVTGDGAVYNYNVDARSMRSTKVHMGKGQRARYFAYELISTGQDFDLDTLEFVPIVVARRV